MVGFKGGPKKALSSMRKTLPALAAAQRAKKGAPTAIGGKGGGVAKKLAGAAKKPGSASKPGFKPKMPIVPSKLRFKTGGSVKKYAEGGLAGLAESAESLMGDVDSMANTINYGSTTGSGSSQPLGFQAVAEYKKGGTVKASSASKRADGCAQRGKTKGRMV